MTWTESTCATYEANRETGHKPGDSVIAGAAADALSSNRAVPSGAVQVSVVNGWITLIGVVDQASQRGAAERAVRNLRGVRGVSNVITLRITPQPQRSAVRIAHLV
jgi:osmotically-inducible protein OsmY